MAFRYRPDAGEASNLIRLMWNAAKAEAIHPVIHWYFAYASNLSIEQMSDRIGPFDFSQYRPQLAHLVGHRLVFNMHDGGHDVYANILAPGDRVLGVAYPCTLAALEKLDQFESGYERRQIDVVTISDERLSAFAYFAKEQNIRHGQAPSAEYLNRILGGARQHGLPDAYIQQIEAIASMNA